MTIDWLWWCAGGVLGLTGLFVIVWAVFWDRSRGRRRCFRCWYDMSATNGRRCPECGREAKREGHLLRTRRRWRGAAGGVLLIVLGFAAIATQQVRRHGWLKATPTIFYIAVLPHLEDAGHTELLERVRSGTLRQWQYRLLISRALGVLRSDRDSEVLHAALIDHADAEVRAQAVSALRSFWGKSAPAIPALLGAWVSEDDRLVSEVQKVLPMIGDGTLRPFALYFYGRHPPPPQLEAAEIAYFRELAACGTGGERVREKLAEGLSHSSEHVRLISIGTLALLWPDESMPQSMGVLSTDPSEHVRRAVMQATSRFEYDDRVREILASGLRDDSINVKIGVVWALSQRALEASEFRDDVRALMDSESVIADEAAICIARLGGDSQIALDALMVAIKRKPPWYSALQLKLDNLTRLNVESPAAAESIREFMNHADVDVRGAAAVAYAKLGGSDLDAATKEVFDAVKASPRAGMAFSRWFWLARNGRFSLPFVKRELQSRNAANRANAARFLGQAGRAAAPALDDLRPLLHDPDPRVVQWAEEAVKRIEWAIQHPEWGAHEQW